jgi:predicted XRE-type DNA-binding protein
VIAKPPSNGHPTPTVTKGSGNVFRDLGLPDADLLQAKADLVHRISVLIGKRGMSQTQAAEVLGIAQPKISALLHGRLDGFSMDRLVRFLISLDQDVQISVRSKVKARPMVKVA